jgi:hypothetical protein
LTCVNNICLIKSHDYDSNNELIHCLSELVNQKLEYSNKKHCSLPQNQINSFNLKVNDIVQISSDIEFIKSVQKGHGEFADAMKPVFFFFFIKSLIVNYFK